MSPSIGPVSGYQFLMCMCTATYAFTSLVGYQRWGARGYAPNDYCFSVLRYAAVRFLFYSLYVLGWHHALLGPAPYFLLSEGLPNYYFFSTTLQALLERLRELRRAVDEGEGGGEESTTDPKWYTFLKFMLVPDLEQLLGRASSALALLRLCNACFGFGLSTAHYRVYTALLGLALFLGFALFRCYPCGEDAAGSARTTALRRHALLFTVANVGAFVFHVYNASLGFRTGGRSHDSVGGVGSGGVLNKAGSGGGGGGKPALMLVLMRVGDALLFWLWAESIPETVTEEEDHED